MPRSRHSTPDDDPSPPGALPPSTLDRWPTPFWATGDGRSVRYYLGDVRAVLTRLPAGSVQCVVTSPPYWGLRDYATGDDKHLEIGAEPSPDCDTKGRARCGRCYVCNLVDVFRGVRRVLRDDGVAWLNLGSSYEDDGNLIGVPWLVALALQADGWVLRQDVIWAKPAPMPESVTDRCTKAHEYVFLLAKGPGYFYDNEAIKEPSSGEPTRGKSAPPGYSGNPNSVRGRGGERIQVGDSGADRNKRSVWTVSHGGGYSGLHFAVFPPALVEPMILAGTSGRGACPDCGTPWRRVVEKERVATRPGLDGKVWEPGDNKQDQGDDPRLHGFNARYKAKRRKAGAVTGNRDPERHVTTTETVGWEPGCGCGRPDVVPCVVMDPFLGSGTVAEVCLKAGRACVGIDLSTEYLTENAVPRAVETILGDYRIEERVGGFPNPERWRRIVEARQLTSAD